MSSRQLQTFWVQRDLVISLGVRCKASFAEQVHGCIKPGGSFLPPGKKSLYLLGPLPFGTVRDSLIELLA